MHRAGHARTGDDVCSSVRAPKDALANHSQAYRRAEPTAPGPDAPFLEERLLSTGADGVIGSELWVTDGTKAGTSPVKDINREGDGSAVAESIAMFPDCRFLCTANDGVHGSELWLTERGESGTMLLLDINAEADSSPRKYYAYGGRVFFNATTVDKSGERWLSEGTTEGTYLVMDVCEGVFERASTQETLGIEWPSGHSPG